MQNISNSNVTIALIAFVLMLTIVSASFTAVTFAVQPNDYHTPTGPAGHPLASEPTKRSYYNPVPAWQLYQEYTGSQPAPSPWYAGASSGWARYNVTSCNYNAYSTAPRTAHIRFIHQYGPGGIRLTAPEWGYNFRLGPREQMGDAYSGMLAFGGYMIVWIAETGGLRLQAIDEWTGQIVWETKMLSTIGDQPWWLLNAAGGPLICCRGGNSIYQYSLQTGNLVQTYTFPYTPVMYYNSSKFAELEIGETELFAPGGVVYCSSGDYTYCYTWASTPVKLWGPVRSSAQGTPDCLVDDVLCYSRLQTGVVVGIDAITGETLWENTVMGNMENSGGGYGMFYVPTGDGSIHAFDVKTGELVWRNENITASYWNEFFLNVGDGKVLDCNRDGNIYCLDAFTGEFLWSFFAGPSPYEPWKSYYGVYGFHIVGIGGGSDAYGTGPGVYYAAVGDESIGTVPSVPGNYLYALDMETGELLFKYPGGAMSHNQLGATFDGLTAVYNPVTSQVICFGKGNTKIELSTDVQRISSGGYTWITGRLTDQSPAHPGTPCVSEDSMEAWMTYLHGGYPEPPAGLIKGVPLSLVAVDSANNVIDLGTVTTDAMGYFKVKWTTPNKEEMYQITASFAEDGSYYSSWAVTDLVVGPAVSSTSATGSSVAMDTTMITVTLVAIVVVACIGAVNVAALIKMRRHKGGNKQ